MKKPFMIVAVSIILVLLLTSCTQKIVTTTSTVTTSSSTTTTTTKAAPTYKVPTIPIVNGPIASPSNANHALGMFQVNGVPSGPTDFAYPKLPAGYSEAEYFISDTASIYEWADPNDPNTTIRPVTGYTDIPYTTRMMVIYPTDAKNFSGNVFINPMNPSTGHDLFVPWERSSDYFIRSGDAYVGWTCKSVCVAALQAWNPTRYASLDWPYKPFTPGNNSAKYDGLTYEMTYQIGALFKTNATGSPLQSYNVKRIYEPGFSQDGGFISNQIVGFQHYFRLSDGSSVYDGYSPQGNTGASGFGAMSSLNMGLTANGTISTTNPKGTVSGSDVPVIFIDTENEVKWATISTNAQYNPLFNRADSDNPNDLFRLWEVPGDGHVDYDTGSSTCIDIMIGWELTGQVKMAPRGCAHYTDDQWINRQFPVDHFGFVCSAAYDAMKKWRVNGTPAPKADRITESGTPLAVVQDKYGNALGGIRTPYMVVPTALWGSSETGTPGPCSSYMYMIPFTSDVLKGLYTDHNDYVTKFTAAANALVTSGFWLKEDAQNAIAEATSAKIP